MGVADDLVEGDGSGGADGAEGGVDDMAGGAGGLAGVEVGGHGLDEDAGPAEGLEGEGDGEVLAVVGADLYIAAGSLALEEFVKEDIFVFLSGEAEIWLFGAGVGSEGAACGVGRDGFAEFEGSGFESLGSALELLLAVAEQPRLGEQHCGGGQECDEQDELER